MKYGFGVDLGGTTVKMALFAESGNVLSKWEIPTRREDGGAGILPDIAAEITRCLQERKIAPTQVIGIGIGVPGPVLEDGTVNQCINLGWGVFNIEKELKRRTGYPVKAGNDATLAALGESYMGGGKGHRNMVFATLGTGVGGGIVVNGKILPGANGAGGEIGHMVLETQETEACNCGKKGCVEQYCSATGVVRLAKRRLEKDDTPSALRSIENLTCKDVFDAGKAGDALALAVLEQVYEYLGRFLANVSGVVDSEIIVLGGGVSKAGAPLVNGAKKYYEKYAFHACRKTPIVLAELFNDAGIYGAFKLVLDCFG